MITIGAGRRDGDAGFVDLLAECHQRIRRFSALARTLAAAGSESPDQIRDAAHRVRRYFGEALPLHVQDEEETVRRRLTGTDPELDAALARMGAEHDGHVSLLEQLVELCGQIEQQPQCHAEQRARLGSVADALAPQLAAHLEHEERLIFPAIERLCASDPAVESAMLAELRGRRRSAD